MGVGLTIAAFALVLDPGQVHRLRTLGETRLVQTFPQWPAIWSARVEPPQAAVPASPEAEAEVRDDPPAQALPRAGTQATGAIAPAAAKAALSATPAPATQATPAEETYAAVLTHRFWSDFHSHPAARGFAQQLTSATGVPVEVIEEQPGRYRVGFDYHSEAERHALLRQIETVTGLWLDERTKQMQLPSRRLEQ